MDCAEHALGTGEDAHQIGPRQPKGPGRLLGLYHSVLSRGVFEAVEAADPWQLVTDWAEGGTCKEGVKGARRLSGKVPRCVRVLPATVRALGAWREVMLGHRHTWVDALFFGNTIPTDAKDFMVTT